jgi:hypothetical protein
MAQSNLINNPKQNNDVSKIQDTKLYRSRKVVGKTLKNIGTTLGAIGKPIFTVVPPLRPYRMLLGKNSLYYRLGDVIEPNDPTNSTTETNKPIKSTKPEGSMARPLNEVKPKTGVLKELPRQGGNYYPNNLFHHVY